MKSLLTKLVLIGMGVMLGACSSRSAKEIELADIQGTWKTLSFESGGNSQKPKNPILFIITKDMEFTQKGSGLSFTDKFELKGDSIIVKSSSGDLIHKVLKHSGNTMKLEAKAAMGSTIYTLEKSE